MEPSTHKRLPPSPQRAQSHSPGRHASPANPVSWPHQNLPHSQHHQQHHQEQHQNEQGLGSNLPSRSSSVSPPLNAPSTTPTSTATSTPPVTVHLQPPPPSTHHSGSQSTHSPPPTPPVSAGLPLPLPLFDQAALAVLAQTTGNPPNTPVTPGAFLVSDSEESESDEYEDADEGSSRSDSEREDEVEEEREETTTLSSGDWPHQQLRRSPRSATFVRGESGVAFAEGSRRGSGRKRSSSESIESERGRSRPVERRQPSYLYRTDSAPARFLRLEGLGSVIIEAPKRAISARASGGVRVVDTRKRGKASKGAGECKQCDYLSSTSMRKPSAGFGERARVKKMLESKQMDPLRTSSPPRDVAAFKDRRLPARPSSMLPTPREYYTPGWGDRSENPSPKAAAGPGRRVPSASSEPWRPSLETLSDPVPTMAARISDFPITPIALDLGALSVIADFDELSPTTPRAQNPRTAIPRARASHSSLNKARRRAAQSSRSSSVSATSIRLRSGSVVTVIPPEQTAWQRTVYVAGPIRLNKFQRKATANADDLEAAAKSKVDGLWPRAPSKPDGIASLDAFQDALDSLDPKATFERRASDECALDDLVQYFADWGIPTTECEKDTIDSFWLGASDDEGSVSKSNRSSMDSEWHGAPAEAEADREGELVKSTSDRYSTGTTASSLANNRLSVLSGGMGAVEVELRDEDASSSKRSSRISLRRSPSLRGKNMNSSGSAEKKHKSRGSEGQRTRLRRLVMSAGGIL
ncbi:hypothetical protein IWX49DRAFT_556973 [Phyllosticta citricarpa]|uniref:Uncharacterized protein n=2 Tax=Phyllosticta TaxID=121621 RepID=A0ABR1LEJ2_9PEZI